MIAFDRVTIRYPGAARDATSDVSFEARRGAVTAVVGPNGSGKSTLVRALIRRVPVASGSIRIEQTPIHDVARDELARRVAVVTQREDLAFPTTVDEYVALGRFPHLGMWHAATDRDEQAHEQAMRRAGVETLRQRRTDELSGGEWQRVRLARALAQGGEALVLDEPTSYLDIAHEMAVFEMLSGLARDGQAVLLVSHQLNLVARFASRIVLLDQGRVVAAGSASDVMRPEILGKVYDWPIEVRTDPSGNPTLFPIRSTH